jgi:uncharacterized OB-fold protein
VSFPIPVCRACGEAAFPPRLLCPRCGGPDWWIEAVDGGVVERSTERDGTSIATVRTPLGPVLVARLLGAAMNGDAVRLDAVGAVPVATA